MCEECYHTPHLCGCPEATQPEFRCAACGGIVDAETMISADGEIYCGDCADAFDLDDLLSVYGAASVSELIRLLAS